MDLQFDSDSDDDNDAMDLELCDYVPNHSALPAATVPDDDNDAMDLDLFMMSMGTVHCQLRQFLIIVAVHCQLQQFLTNPSLTSIWMWST